jgi:hypothetical protein
MDDATRLAAFLADQIGKLPSLSALILLDSLWNTGGDGDFRRRGTRHRAWSVANGRGGRNSGLLVLNPGALLALDPEETDRLCLVTERL